MNRVCYVSLRKFDIFWLALQSLSLSALYPSIPLGSMEQEAEESGSKISNVAVDSESYVNDAVPEVRLALFQTDVEESEGDRGENDDGHLTSPSKTQLQRCERHESLNSKLPETFKTNHLLFYERFKAYQDYILGDCKPSEVKAFTADYLEKVLEPCDWLALWSTDIFSVVVEVCNIELKDLKACVELVLPMQCEAKGCEITEEAMKTLLEATQCKVPLQELQVVYEESGDFDQTAIALEHLRFFYKHIWREWDEEDEDDDFDYFVRCVEPRLRLYYDILEERVPAGLVAEYQSLLEKCSQCFQQFSVLRSNLSTDSDSELDNISMVEGLTLYDHLEMLTRKLHIIENPLLRYVLAYRGNSRQHCMQARGPRESGVKLVHVVTASCSSLLLQSLLNDRLLPLCQAEDTEIQFHRDPVSAVDLCHQGDVVIVLPGLYSVTSSIFLPDSITVEGFGLPDEIVIEKRDKGDSFIESTGADVRLSNIKFIQHDAIEGILCVRQGLLSMENCVLQCETTGVIVRTSAHLVMKMCDLYGSKGAGVEIYPGSVCSLIGNGIHHCKDGILIKDFIDCRDVMPSISLENNVIHNNEGYGVIIVKPNNHEERRVSQDASEESKQISTASTHDEPKSAETKDCTEGSAASTSGKKWQFNRQLSRNKEVTGARAVQDLVEDHVFVSIQGNQFKRNGLSDFGTFFY